MEPRASRKILVLKRLNMPSLFWVSLLMTYVSIFGFFRWQSNAENINRSKAVEGLLRSEYMNANSYALSKAIADLETLNLIQCVSLIEHLEQPRTYYDTTSSKRCYRSWIGVALESNIELNAINGLQYRLIFQRPINWESVFLEVIGYVLTTVLLLLYFKRQQRLHAGNLLRLQALELEKKFLEGHTRQIKHDVASPLSAFRAIIGAAKGLDEPIKAVLIKAVERTEAIFAELNSGIESASQQIEPIEISSLIMEITKEKMSVWPKDVSLEFENKGAHLAFGNKTNFQRIISNLLNNSYEALDINSPGHIKISISREPDFLYIRVIDNGRGIPDSIRSKIGQKGFSFGKENIEGAGSGLGLHSAIQTVKAWGGDLSINSSFGNGAEVIIKLKPI